MLYLRYETSQFRFAPLRNKRCKSATYKIYAQIYAHFCRFAHKEKPGKGVKTSVRSLFFRGWMLGAVLNPPQYIRTYRPKYLGGLRPR